MSIDDLAKSYSSILSSLVDRFAPRIVVKKHHRPITPWFNAVCRAEKRRSRCLERVYRRTRLARDRTMWVNQLRSAQLVYQRVQHEYWQMLITNSSGNARKLWNSLSSVMGRNRGSPVQPGLTADAFSKFFSDKVDDVRSSTAGSTEPEYTVFHGHPLDEFIQLSISDVVRLIRDSPSKACGLDPIPTWLMKEFVDQLAPYLTYLFNRSLSQGRFPEIFRLAEATPILKKSTLDPSVLSSYRPISNLPFISKVLERAVNERMLQHLHSNGLLPEHQSAYRRSHSTETALLKVTSDALIAADQGRLTLLGMLDLSAAFDCVDHSILLSRLETSFGFAGLVLAWMRSYLVGRKQYVRYNGTTSSTTVMKYGVPQGSVLGPLYFIFYTADAFQIAGELGFFIHGYADDLQIYDHCLACDTSQLTNRLTHCIEVIGRWMSSNRLRLNASKTEFIWLGSTRRLARCTFDPIIINGDTIPPSLTVRDLGAYIDSGINFDEHVTRLTRTCFFHIRQLRSIRRSLTIESSHALVRALVLSRLDYCNGLLGGAPKCLLGPLSGVLRAAARLILLLPRSGSVTDRISH